MPERYWTVKQGDAIVVHTDYAKSVARFQDGFTSTQRGGGAISAQEDADAYCRALEAKGYIRHPVK